MHKRLIHLIIFVLLTNSLLAGCLPEIEIQFADPTPVIQADPLPTNPLPTNPPASQPITLFFTDPDAPGAEELQGGPDEPLAQAIQSARVSVDMAIYQLNLGRIGSALLDAHQRGVKVRLVTESDYGDEEVIEQLKDAGIQVIGDRRESLMHNKFTVIDRAEVWTGSMNYTKNDVYRNNNNLIRIRSQRLAQNYTTEFEEMFVDDLFGADDLPATPYPELVVDGTRLEVLFSPDDRPTARLVELVEQAQHSVRFLAFSFTSNELAGAVLERAEAGVQVQGVFESSQVESNTGGEFENFQDAGLDVRLDGNRGNMHNKVIIIDDQIVITGSFNFSANAEKRNDENVLIMWNPNLAAQYQAEFAQIWGQAQTEE